MQLSLKVRSALLAVMLAAAGHYADRQAQTRRPSRALPDLTNNVNAIKFSPDGHLLAIARGLRDDNRVDLWDTGTGTLQRTIRGFDGPVWSVSFSPNGRTLVTASSGFHPQKVAEKGSHRTGKSFAELKWWDVETGEFKQRYELRDEDLMSVAAAYSPDGKSLAAIENRLQFSMVAGSTLDPGPYPRVRGSMRTDSTIKLLDANTGETIFKLKEGFNSAELPMFLRSQGEMSALGMSIQRRAVIFSPNGQYVAAWNGKEVRLWQSASGAEALKLNKFKGLLKAIAFSPDSQLVAAAIMNVSRQHDQVGFQSEIRVWDIATGTAKQVIPLRTQLVSSIAFAPNGRQLLVGGLQRREDQSYPSMELVDLQTGSMGSIISRQEGAVSAIDVSPDGGLMAFQTGVSTVRLLETEGWLLRYTFDAGSEASSSGGAALRRYLVSVKSVPAVAFLPNGITVAGEVEGGGIKFWDARTGEVKHAFAGDAQTGSIAEVSANGAVLAEINEDENVRVWNLANETHTEISSDKRSVTAIGLSGDGKTLAIAYPDEIGLFRTDEPTPRQITAPIPAKVACVALSLDGKLLAAGGPSGDLEVWNTGDGILQKHFAAGPNISTLVFTPENEALAAGSKDGHVSLWNLQSSALSFEAKKHSQMVNAIAFSSDGKLMATGSDDRTAMIWEVASGKVRHTLKGHDFTVTSLAFSPGSNLLAVGSGNAEVVLWDVATGKLNRVMR